MAITHVASAAGSTSNPVRTDAVTLSASIQAGDFLEVWVHNRYADQAVNLTGVTDDDTGGNTWAMKGASANGRLSLWWKIATSGTASKVVTATLDVDGAILMGYSAHRSDAGGFDSGSITNLVFENNASGNETMTGFTPAAANSFIGLAVAPMNDVAVSNQSTTSPGALAERFDKVSSAAQDHGLAFAEALQSGGPTATGNLTWSQTNVESDSGARALAEVQSVPPNDGTASGAVSWAGSATGSTVHAGSGTGAVSWAGTVTGTTTHEGSASGAIDWAGTVTGEAPPNSGAASGAVGWAGSVTGISEYQGSTSGAIGWAGSAEGTTTHEGSVSGAIGWVGSADGNVIHEGAASGVIGWVGSTTGSSAYQGAAAGAVDWAGSATGESPAPGVNDGSTSGTITWNGSATGSAVHEGDTSGSITWNGSATGEAPTISQGAASGAVNWVGTVTGVAALEGSVSGNVVWAGSATGTIGDFYRIVVTTGGLRPRIPIPGPGTGWTPGAPVAPVRTTSISRRWTPGKLRL